MSRTYVCTTCEKQIRVRENKVVFSSDGTPYPPRCCDCHTRMKEVIDDDGR